MGSPAIAANFVEMRRVASELADVEAGAGRGRGRLARRSRSGRRDGRRVGPADELDGSAGPAPIRIGLTGPIGCGKSDGRRAGWPSAARS